MLFCSNLAGLAVLGNLKDGKGVSRLLSKTLSGECFIERQIFHGNPIAPTGVRLATCHFPWEFLLKSPWASNAQSFSLVQKSSGKPELQMIECQPVIKD
jgi:hypothetical protein